MAVIEDLIREEGDGTISFGNYKLDQKAKKSDFKHNGDLYKVKTFQRSPSLRRMRCLFMNLFPGRLLSIC